MRIYVRAQFHAPPHHNCVILETRLPSDTSSEIQRHLLNELEDWALGYLPDGENKDVYLNKCTMSWETLSKTEFDACLKACP